MASNTGCTCVGELLMTLSTSEVAVCFSSASESSRVSVLSFFSSPRARAFSFSSSAGCSRFGPTRASPFRSSRNEFATVRSALHAFARQCPPVGTLIDPSTDVEVRRTGIVDCSARAANGHAAAPPANVMDSAAAPGPTPGSPRLGAAGLMRQGQATAERPKSPWADLKCSGSIGKCCRYIAPLKGCQTRIGGFKSATARARSSSTPDGIALGSLPAGVGMLPGQLNDLRIVSMTHRWACGRPPGGAAAPAAEAAGCIPLPKRAQRAFLVLPPVIPLTGYHCQKSSNYWDFRFRVGVRASSATALAFPMRTVPLTQVLTARRETSQVPMRSLCT